jgi:signal transduction histidine kinase
VVSAEPWSDRLTPTGSADAAEWAQLLAREQQRIAGALHDRLEQSIFAIGIRLGELIEKYHFERALADELESMRQVLIDASNEVRSIIFALVEPAHRDVGLTNHLRASLRDLERTSPLHAHLSVTGVPAPAVDAVRAVMRSVVQEALTNINKHADARTVLVSLGYHDDRVDVVIQDDGVGAPEVVLGGFQDSHLHFGLRHMSEQSIQHGGSFEIANGDETGLVLKVGLPLPPGDTCSES